MNIVNVIFAAVLFVLSCAPALSCHGQQSAPRGVWSADWSSDGQYIAIGGDDSTLRLHRGTDFSFLRSMRLDAEVKCLQWHPHEALLAIATTRGLHWYEVYAQTLTAVSTITAGGRAIDWDHTGQRLAFADGKGVVQIIGRDGELIRSIPKHNRHSYVTVDWHPTEDWILTGSDELILWSGSGAQLAFIRHRPQNTLVLTAQWHPSGTFFTSGDYGHASEGTPTLLQFWAAGGNLMLQRLGHEKEIRNLRWTKDGRYLATASDGIRIWDPHGKLLFHERSQDVIWGLSWNPEGTHLITAEFSGRVHIRDHAGRIVHVLYDKP